MTRFYLATAIIALLAPLGCSSSSGSPNTVLVPDGGTDTASGGGGDVSTDTATAGDAATDAASPSDGATTVACSSLTNPLYVMSGDTQVPILKTLGKALRQDTTTPTTLVWFATGSCTIIDAVYNNTPLKQNLSYIPNDPSWDPSSGTVPTCTPDAAGVPVQLGIPIVFPESCTTATPPTTIKAYKGPIQSFVFVVPKASTAQAISAEEAYLTFGFGAAGMVSPWLDPTFYFVRPATKGTQVSMGAMIDVPAAKWKGQPIDQSTAVASMTAASSAPDKTIGILGAEIYDSAANRAALRSLTFQAYTQANGYLPDTSGSAFDKRNVRDGHYVGWSHVFYLTSVDGNAMPTDARAARVIDIFTGAPTATPPPGLDPLTLVSGKGLVPICAMNVERDAEGGPLTTYQSPDPCGCAYEAAVGTAPSGCVTCTGTARAPAPADSSAATATARRPTAARRSSTARARPRATPRSSTTRAPGATRRRRGRNRCCRCKNGGNAARAALTTLAALADVARRRLRGRDARGVAGGGGGDRPFRRRPRRRRGRRGRRRDFGYPVDRGGAAGRGSPVGLHPGRRRAARRVLAGRGRSVDGRAAQSDALSDPARAPAPRHRPRAHVGQPGAGRQHRQRPGRRPDRRRGHRARAHARRLGPRVGQREHRAPAHAVGLRSQPARSGSVLPRAQQREPRAVPGRVRSRRAVARRLALHRRPARAGERRSARRSRLPGPGPEPRQGHRRPPRRQRRRAVGSRSRPASPV